MWRNSAEERVRNSLENNNVKEEGERRKAERERIQTSIYDFNHILLSLMKFAYQCDIRFLGTAYSNTSEVTRRKKRYAELFREKANMKLLKFAHYNALIHKETEMMQTLLEAEIKSRSQIDKEKLR